MNFDIFKKFILTVFVALSFAAPSFGQDVKPTGGLDKVLTGQGQRRELQGELLITRNEEHALAQLQKLLKKHKGTPLEVGLWFRMAELKIRRAKTARFFEMNKDSAEIVRFSPQVTKNKSSKRYISEGIAIYDKIQKDFPDFRDMDLVLFNNGFARQQIGENTKAKALYKKLIKEYNNSLLVPDAYLALGEMYYDERNYKTALEHFNAIRNYPNSNVYAYGLYKAAWSYYNTSNTPQGLKNLEEVVAFSRAQEKSDNSVGRLDLKREALNDMVLFFSEIYSSKDAYKYFAKHADPVEIGPLMLKLSGLYSHHGKHKDLQIVLNEYIDNLPHSLEVPRAHLELINNYEFTKNRKMAVDQIERLALTCDPDSKWNKYKDKESKSIVDMKDELGGDCFITFKGIAATLASKWHKQWLKNKADSVQADAAEKAYELYLSRTKNEPNYLKGLYAHAELLFARNKYRPASEKYTIVAQNIEDKKIKHDANYAALTALDKAVKDKWSDGDEAKFRALVKLYLQHNPNGKHSKEIRFKQAFIAYEKNRFDEAGEDLLVIANDPVKDDRTLKSQDLYLDILNSKKDFTNLKVYSSKWLNETKVPARKAKLEAIYQESYFSEVQRDEEKGKLALASKNYKIFAKENTKSPLAEKAFWNAIQIEYKTNDLLGAAESTQEFHKLFPKSDKVKEALIKSVQTFEFIGRLDRAVGVVEDLIKIDSENEEKWLMASADFKFLSGSFDKAKVDYRKLTRSKTKATIDHAYEQLFRIEQKKGTVESRKQFQDEVLSKGIEPYASEYRLEAVQLSYENKDYKSAFKLAMDILNEKRASAKAKAGARFYQASILDQEMRAQSVNASAEKVGIVLSMKTEKLDKAQRAYQSVVKFGYPEFSVKAIYNLGLSYDHYVKAVRGMRITRDATPEDIKALKAELEKVTLPIEDKAIDTLGEAIQLAKKLEERSGVIAQIQEDINRLNMRNISSIHGNVTLPKPAYPVMKGDQP